MTDRVSNLSIRLKPAERAELEAAAAAADERLSVWIRTAALAVARGHVTMTPDATYAALVDGLAAVEPDASQRVRHELEQLRSSSVPPSQ